MDIDTNVGDVRDIRQSCSSSYIHPSNITHMASASVKFPSYIPHGATYEGEISVPPAPVIHAPESLTSFPETFVRLFLLGQRKFSILHILPPDVSYGATVGAPTRQDEEIFFEHFIGCVRSFAPNYMFHLIQDKPVHVYELTLNEKDSEFNRMVERLGGTHQYGGRK